MREHNKGSHEIIYLIFPHFQGQTSVPQPAFPAGWSHTSCGPTAVWLC